MGRVTRRQILTALGIVMLMGIALHFRIWTIDHRLSANDAELLRRQFDLASRAAMDESAEWRRRYDSEVEKSTQCYKELEEVKKFPNQTREDSIKKIEMLQKENVDLLDRLESLKQELEAEKLKCSV